MAQSALMRMGRPPSIQSSRSPTQSVRAPGGGGLAVWRQDSTAAIAACSRLLALFLRRLAVLHCLSFPPPDFAPARGGGPDAGWDQRGKDAPHRQRCRPDRARRTLA